jgi:hypothetical protein
VQRTQEPPARFPIPHTSHRSVTVVTTPVCCSPAASPTAGNSERATLDSGPPACHLALTDCSRDPHRGVFEAPVIGSVEIA